MALKSDDNKTNIGKSNPPRLSLAAFLELVKNNKITKFEPTLKPKVGFSYVGLESKNLEGQLETLASLEKEGVVSQKGSTVALKCPDCSSYHLCMRLACQSCGSGNLIKGNVIEHIPCGNNDFDEKYLDDSGRLVCKKCGKRLNALGVDYSRPGHFYRCNSCKSLLPVAREYFSCLGCGSESNQEDLAILTLPVYSVELDMLDRFATGMEGMVEVLSNELDKRGIRNIHPASIPGASGVSQTFSIVIYSGLNLPLIVGDTVDQYPTHETAILSIFAKSIDAGIRHHILLTHEDLEPKSKALASAYGIRVININPLDMQTSAWESADNVSEMYEKLSSTQSQKLSVEGH
jgi:Thaumarchaeal output domain 1